MTADKQGLLNSKEDKATIAQSFADSGELSSLNNPDTPVVKKKLEIILARLYNRIPNYVRYLADRTDQPVQIPDYNCGDTP